MLARAAPAGLIARVRASGLLRRLATISSSWLHTPAAVLTRLALPPRRALPTLAPQCVARAARPTRVSAKQPAAMSQGGVQPSLAAVATPEPAQLAAAPLGNALLAGLPPGLEGLLTPAVAPAGSGPASPSPAMHLALGVPLAVQPPVVAAPPSLPAPPAPTVDAAAPASPALKKRGRPPKRAAAAGVAEAAEPAAVDASEGSDSLPTPAKKRRGRPPGSKATAPAAAEAPSAELPTSSSTEASPKRRGRPPGSRAGVAASAAAEVPTAEAPTSPTTEASPKRRGRPAGSKAATASAAAAALEVPTSPAAGAPAKRRSRAPAAKRATKPMAKPPSRPRKVAAAAGSAAAATAPLAGARGLGEEDVAFPTEEVEVMPPSRRSGRKKSAAAAASLAEPATEEEEEEAPVAKPRRKRGPRRQPDPLPFADPTPELLAELQQRQPPPLPVPNLGYACLNMALRHLKPPIFTSRDCIKRTLDDKGLPYLGELCLANCRDLARLIQWNAEQGIRLFRISSVLFPWMGTFKAEELPNYEEVAAALRFAGDLARAHGQRLTFHPSHFVKLAAPNEQLAQKSINELEAHSKIFDLMGYAPSPENKINIHMGGVYGSKPDTIQRFVQNFQRLSPNCRARLTVENDDVATSFSLQDLLELHSLTGIPLVFDFHHHRFCPGGLSEREAFLAAVKTWPAGVRPVVHWSESQEGRRPHAHSDYVRGPIYLHGLEAEVDVMIEAKMKEQALLCYRDGIPIPEGSEPKPLAMPEGAAAQEVDQPPPAQQQQEEREEDKEEGEEV